MKRKILFAVSFIGIFSISAIIYADLASSNNTSILSDQEMAELFGKEGCEPCTLGEAEPVQGCLTGSCPPCVSFTQCFTAYYPSGEYVYTCVNTGIEDGYCLEGELIDCKRRYYCEINGSWYPDRHCNGYCKTPAAKMGCVNCKKGDPWWPMEQQRDWTCACG